MLQRTALICAAALGIASLTAPAKAADYPDRLLWGDTHVHTSYSPDAYLLFNRTSTPDSAYRFAKGLPVIHPWTKDKARISTPLDFLVVSDHAEWLGGPKALFAGDQRIANTPTGKRLIAMVQAGQSQEVARELIAAASDVGTPDADTGFIEDIDHIGVRRSAWQDIADAADRHNAPGRFSALIGWEWSSLPDGANLHRVVIMGNGADVAKQFVPYSMLRSQKPEDLWDWLERTEKATGAEFVAIPHNSNLSKGRMFTRTDSAGRPMLAAHARRRLRWEPIVEITQFKGDSETHPALAPDDPFADFEPYGYTIDLRADGDRTATITAADYVRPALKTGLELEAATGINPYQVGVIGSTDTHTGMSSYAETNFMGKFPSDSIPERKPLSRLGGATGWDMGAGGLAAVWAKDNTRAEIIAAFKRREVYATTGPRIAVRVFGGYAFDEDDKDARNLAELGYRKGVPMGGTLSAAPDGKAPSFLIHAAHDPLGARLDRVQIIKGWLDEDGKAQERIYDVAWSEGRTRWLGAVAPIASTVDAASGRYDRTSGAVQLAAVWRDPNFDPQQRAFYYVRVLEVPSPRHSLLDALALGIAPAETGHPPAIQERAYSSPIWYAP